MPIFKKGGVYHYAFALNGVRYRGSTKESTPGKARAFEAIIMSRAIEGRGNPKLRKSPLLSEVAKSFLLEIEKSTAANNMDGDTLRHYRNGWRMLSETFVAGMRIDQITRGTAASLSFPGGPWNARAAQQVLGRLLHWAEETGILHAAPRIKRSKAQGRELRVEPWMEQKLLEHMEQDVADVFLIMLDCGMRPEEVMRMRWEHVDWSRGEYFNPFGKTDESRRYVPMADRMINILRRRQADAVALDGKAKIKAETWVFQGKTKAGHRSTVAKQYEEARAAAGLNPKLVLYCARHEFGTTFIENGGDLATLKKVMGHTSIATTEKYLHPGIKGAADVINRRNRAGLKIVKSA